MAEHWHGNFCFRTTTAFTEVGSFERTIFASGPLVMKRTKAERGVTPDAIGGSILSHDPTLTGMNKGHLIALSLGGPNIPYNIVPMFAHFNKAGAWKAMEREIEATGNYSGRYLSIGVIYQPDAPYVPAEFHISLTDTMPGILVGQKVLKMQRQAAAPYPLDAELKELLVKIMTPADWAATDYAFLDNHRPALGVSPTSIRAKFNDRQRDIIKSVNALRSHKAGNNGMLVSDDANDLHPVLNSYGDNDFPEIDHIMPYKFGGSNAFANARVISHKHNNSRRAQITAEQHDAMQVEAKSFRDNRPRRGSAHYG